MVTYHHLQIFVHKPFITPLESMVTSLTFPSLAICTFAARSCARIVEVQSKRSLIPLASMQTAVFNAALVLLLNIWTGQQSGLEPNPKDLEDIRICMGILKVCLKEGRTRHLLTSRRVSKRAGTAQGGNGLCDGVQ